ncbi:MAG: DUF4234 domain-containing protein [Capsulimonadaceae bacterium]
MPGETRNPALVILLTLFTCGIYYLAFIYTVSRETNNHLGRREFDPGAEVLLNLVTCFLWSIYWDWRVGKLLVEMGARAGVPVSDNSILLLVLDLVGLGFVNAAIEQDILNRLWAGAPSDGPYYGAR